MKKFINRSLLGILFGAFVAVVIMNSIIIFGDMEQFSGEWFLKNSLGSVLSGWLLAISILFFESSRLSLLQKTVIHFPILLSFNFLFSYLGWGLKMTSQVGLLIFTGIYFATWFIIFSYYKLLAKQMNDELKKI